MFLFPCSLRQTLSDCQDFKFDPIAASAYVKTAIQLVRVTTDLCPFLVCDILSTLVFGAAIKFPHVPDVTLDAIMRSSSSGSASKGLPKCLLILPARRISFSDRSLDELVAYAAHGGLPFKFCLS